MNSLRKTLNIECRCGHWNTITFSTVFLEPPSPEPKVRMMKQLNAFFETIVEVPRIRIGGRQTIETLINEEALLLAKYLRNERQTWTPRIVDLS